MRWRVVLTALLLTTVAAAADEAAVKVVEHKGRWESGYGAEFYNVVGRVKNASDHTVKYVKLRVEALAADGKVVASTETYNESAEALTIPGAKSETVKVAPLAAGAEERFRASFLKEETPAFETYRVVVVESPRATP